ncbi:MAG: hypothetical protein EOO09_02240 [Chitinophagaceae bacterium]|nr:MAG: hypothetical protein EOO09_02240 [Chitinophagaceae bacterium]
MKLFLALFTAILTVTASIAQQPAATAAQTPLESARTYMRAGDFDNAIIVLKRALQADSKNVDMQKELVMSYFYKRDYANAQDGVKVLLDNDNADVVSYQIAGNVYKALEQVKEADKMYKKGLKKFPQSGPLYSEYGELLWSSKNFSAIDYWEKGIQVDPSYSGNYYNAALYYFYTKEKVWNLIYGEIFVNMESLSQRGTAMKEMLLKGYKEKLFEDVDILKGQEKNKSEFARAFLGTMAKQSLMVNRGINVEVLTQVRIKFLLEWYKENAAKYPFRLFDEQRLLLREGLFEAYNQWLFGAAENLAAYDSWTKSHAEQFEKLDKFFRNRVFKMPAGQYYQPK